MDRAVAALGVSGEGVIVAILDRGIDWENADFRNEDGSTRIAYIFDMGDDSGATAPGNPYGRGTIYARQQINQALFGGPRLLTRDAVGHGTTSTGISAGNGRNSPDGKYRGVAPNATIISVKVTSDGAPAHGGEPAESAFYVGRPGILVAIDFVVDKARELSMPVVMLLNLGSIGGPTDGTSALSRKIDDTVGPDHPGIVFVTGTGDDGIPSKTQNRAAGIVPNGESVDLRFALDTGAGNLEVWYGETEALDVSIDTPAGLLGPYPASQFEAVGAGVRLFHYRGGDDFYGSRNGKRLLWVSFDGAAGGGDYVLRLDHQAGSRDSSIRFDASLNTLFGESGRFQNFVTPGSIWDGATAFHNVAPNSYVIRTRWTDINGDPQGLFGEGEVGELWTGSSVGPTVDGRVGVDVSAPGDRVVTAYAPRSHWATFPQLLIADGGGLYGMAGAVSAAAPVVTGIIALMLEIDPTLDALSVKRILHETARSDQFTGTTPNPNWGYGKVDAFGAVMAAVPDDDHGGTVEMATRLAIGPPQTGTLDGAGDIDYFRMDLAGSAAVIVKTSGRTDTRGELLDGTGALLGSDDDGGPGGHNFRIAADVEPGVYYVRVSGESGSYSLSAELVESADHGDTAASSTLLTLYSTMDIERIKPSALLSTAGRIGAAGSDTDVFRIDVPRDGTDVTVRSAGNTDTSARLLDSKLVELASNDGGDGNFRIETTLDADVYYVEVTGHEDGAYRVLAWGSDPDCACASARGGRTSDHGDSAEAATLMAIGPPLTGSIADATDVDVFRVDLAGSASVAFATAGPTDVRGVLRDGAGAMLAADDGSGPGGHNFRISRELSPGVYYLEVSGATGSYAVSAQLVGEADHGDTAALSTLLPLYSDDDVATVKPSALLSTAGRIHAAETDMDVFRLDIPKDGTRLKARAAGSTNTFARLRDSSLTEIAMDDGEGAFYIETEVDAGIYYLEVGGHETGGYRVLAWGNPPDTCPCTRRSGTNP